MTMEAPSKFAQLPAELLLKILDETDNRGILSCTDLSPFLRTAGVDILLQRHNVLDPSVYCEVQAIVPGCLSQLPLPDALSALLASSHRYPGIKHLYCTIRPPQEYDERFHQRDPEEILFMWGDDPLPQKPLSKRLELTFNRLGRLLARVEVVGEVTIRVLDWRAFPACFSNLLEEFIHSIIRSGCTSLQVQCPRVPFKGKLWSFPAPVEPPPPRGLSLSSMFSTLCGFLGSSASQQSQVGHLRLHSASSAYPALHPRITKLDIDSTFFHPSTIHWTSNLLRHSPVTELTVSSKDSLSWPWFPSEGIAAILEGVPRLQSLSLLEFDAQDIQDIAPRLRPFTALKNLRISLKNSCLPRGFGEGAATPFCPSNLERLSISPKIIGYMLLGTVTALNLKEIEIMHGTFDTFDARRIVDGVATVRDFFSKIQAPISIAVTLACEAYRIFTYGGEVKMDNCLTSLRSMVSLPLAKDLEVTKARIKGNLPWIDTLSLELYPSALCSLNSDNVGIILDSIGFFEGLRTVAVGGVKDFRRAQGRQEMRVPDAVPKAIVQPAFSRYRALASLWIEEEEYLRPLMEI